jgi:hypothetical protein
LILAVFTLASVSAAEAGPTNGDKEALAAAKEYLNSQAFSLKGLIAQLDSPDGSGFTVAQATYGADHCDANWTKEALLAAKEYLQSQPFSFRGLIRNWIARTGVNSPSLKRPTVQCTPVPTGTKKRFSTRKNI